MHHPLPSALLDSLKGIKGFDESSFVEIHTKGQQIVSIRLNPNKSINLQYSSLEISSRVPWSTHGYYLTSRPSFTLDPLFHAGAYYVQEASSMFLEQVLKQSVDLNQDLKVLDLCAAPGGKSTLIQSLLSSNSMLVSNEVIKSRVTVLAENITKWGAANVIVTNNDPSDFQRLSDFFDVIVVDAPCSGSGLFRKDPDAIEEWSKDNVIHCSQRQQRILADVLPALKENGLLVYSTCSYSKEENEQIADWLSTTWQMKSVQIQLDQAWGITEVETEAGSFGYRFYPDKTDGEGFFITAFIKTGSDSSVQHVPKKQPIEWVSKKERLLLEKWVQSSDQYDFFSWNDMYFAVPAAWKEALMIIRSSLYIRQSGICIGTKIREDINPAHSWCISNLAAEVLPVVAWNRDNVLQYLRLSTELPSMESKGWVCIKYGGLSIGLAKSMPNRVNNYYPKEWRIINR